jgi:hypothetical protein
LPGEFRVVLGFWLRVSLGFFWVLGSFFGVFLWANVGFLMYTHCVLRGALRFFDIYNITYQKKETYHST